MEERIIKVKKSIIVAADVTEQKLPLLINAVSTVPGISAIKIGFSLGLRGLGQSVRVIRASMPHTKIIYDHQKAGNDIPATGKEFSQVLKESGVDAAILFPFTGPATQKAWTNDCREAGLPVITGGIMTHQNFLFSEGGYISDEAPEQIYTLACELGVRHFVVPGNKIEWVKKIRELLVKKLGEGNFDLLAPGFITQDGDISECGKAAGDIWHAIVGSAIYNKPTVEEMEAAAILVTKQIGIKVPSFN
jgi:orotidine-5'-phosphate decarboxylase